MKPNVSIAPTHCEVLVCIADTKKFHFVPSRKSDARTVRALVARGFVRVLPGGLYALTRLGYCAAALAKAAYKEKTP